MFLGLIPSRPDCSESFLHLPSIPDLCSLSQNCGRMLTNPFAFLQLISRPCKGGLCALECLWHNPSAPGMGFCSPHVCLLCPWSCGASFFNPCAPPLQPGMGCPAWGAVASSCLSDWTQLFFALLLFNLQLICVRIKVRNACPPHPLFIFTNYASQKPLV